MSACDCDRKDSNGGSCDCKEESFGIVENVSSPVSFAPILAVSKVAGAVEIVSFEGHTEHV